MFANKEPSIVSDRLTVWTAVITVSEAPSYHTTVSNGESIPPYTPPVNNTTTSGNLSSPSNSAAEPRTHSLRTLLPSSTAHISSPGLPPIPPASQQSNSRLPTLHAFSIPSWSIVNANPTYQRVATRRAQAAMSSGEGLLRNAARALERVNEEGGAAGSSAPGSGLDSPSEAERVRPLEDPYLVGEEAAARARRDRLARESHSDDVLHREDRRWDWFLGMSHKDAPSRPHLPELISTDHIFGPTAQQRDWEERERSWKQFRRSMSATSGMSRGRLARRFAAGGR